MIMISIRRPGFGCVMPLLGHYDSRRTPVAAARVSRGTSQGAVGEARSGPIHHLDVVIVAGHPSASAAHVGHVSVFLRVAGGAIVPLPQELRGRELARIDPEFGGMRARTLRGGLYHLARGQDQLPGRPRLSAGAPFWGACRTPCCAAGRSRVGLLHARVGLYPGRGCVRCRRVFCSRVGAPLRLIRARVLLWQHLCLALPRIHHCAGWC